MKCLDCKFVDILEQGANGFIGETVITCKMCNEITGDMDNCEDFKPVIVSTLENVWKKCDTKQLSAIFESYMESIGVRKHDERRKDNTNTYMIDGKSTGWNRVECYYHKDSHKYCEEDLLLVLRKKSGDYLIIQRKDKMAFEVDYSGLRHYDKALLEDIMKDHKPLFDMLLAIA